VLLPRVCALQLRRRALHQRPLSVQLSWEPWEGSSHLGPVTLRTCHVALPRLAGIHARYIEPFVHVAVVVLALSNSASARVPCPKRSNLMGAIHKWSQSIAEPL
jgi:hypothetical protein